MLYLHARHVAPELLAYIYPLRIVKIFDGGTV
jgi:hypothetical protein